MRNSVYLSAAAHSVLILLALVALPSPEELPAVPTRALPVELITVDELTNLKRQQKTEKPKPVEEPEPPKEVEKPKTEAKPEPKPAPTPPPVPEQKPEIIPENPVEKKEPPKPVEKKVEPPKPPQKQPEKKSFDPNRIADLLNKMPDAAPKPAPSAQVDEDVNAPSTDDPAMKLTLSEEDYVRQKVEGCWDVLDLMGTAGANKLYAEIRFSLNRDGSLAGRPVINRSGGGTLARTFAERAVMAVLSCAPYDKLSPNKYQGWKEFSLTFRLPDAL
jgi:hypothetical protein